MQYNSTPEKPFEICPECPDSFHCFATPQSCARKTAPVLTKNSPSPATIARLDEFDSQTQKVTEARGNVYGHPKKDFRRVSRLKEVVAECSDPLARHALEMICVKMARLIETPTHLDSWIDIAGYAKTGVMVTDD